MIRNTNSIEHMQTAPWIIEVRNDSWNFRELDCRFTAVLHIANLSQRVHQEIQNRTAKLEKHPDGRSEKSQSSVELMRLHLFLDRLARIEKGERTITIGPAELPISFNEPLFLGNFTRLHCWECQRYSTPEETRVRPFEERDGIQAFGKR